MRVRFVGAAVVVLAFLVGCGSGSDTDGLAAADTQPPAPPADVAAPDGGPAPPICGDGVKEGEEVCDGGLVACGEVGDFQTGMAVCLGDCAGWDTSTCGTICRPDCLGRSCGSDGCGGSCGTCTAPDVCVEEYGLCLCPKTCGGRVCGDDGCGGVCGACGENDVCTEDGQCVCVPNCTGRCCGDDGCGDICPDVCEEAGLVCDAESCGCVTGEVCGPRVAFPDCEELGPAPLGTSSIEKFFQANAVPVRCDTADGAAWDLQVFADDFQGHRIFLFGEVHGSDELGRMSAEVFAHLVRTGAVNALSMEIGVDVTDALNEYIRTGGGPLIREYGFHRFPAGMFLRTLSTRARALYQEGYEIKAFGVDTPLRLAWVNEQIETLAEAFLAETHDLVVDALPPAMELYHDVTTAYLDDARDYRNHVVDHLDTICAELDEADCERLAQLAEALWLGAFSRSNSLYSAPGHEQRQFFSVRETFIYYSYRVNMPDESVRVFTHMGAAHTAKAASPGVGYLQAAGLLDTEYPVTAGAVYSTTPGYGDGSQILYGYDLFSLSGEPWVVANALEDADPPRTFYVSTHRPGHDCKRNPLLSRGTPDLGVLYGEAYDAVTFIDVLTPEAQAKKQPLHPGAAAILTHRAAIAAAEARLFGRP